MNDKTDEQRLQELEESLERLYQLLEDRYGLDVQPPKEQTDDEFWAHIEKRNPQVFSKFGDQPS